MRVIGQVGGGRAGASRVRGALPSGAVAESVRAVGYSDLDGRAGAFKITVLERGGRWCLWVLEYTGDGT